MRPSSRSLVLLAGLAVPALALAHPGPLGHGHADTFLAGLAHPVSGLDHLLAALAVGVWGALGAERGALRAAALFVGMLAIGVAAGGVLGALAGIEPLLATSVVLLGTLLAASFRVPASVAGPLVAVAGLVHGLAHGSEAPQIGLPWLAGIVLATLLLVGAGALAGRGLARASFSERALPWLGGGFAFAGLSLLALQG